jgi:CRISPR-associated protein Csb2
MPCLLISVRFHDGRYHGAGDWPPSPARLFQALVASASQGEILAKSDKDAFKWLESLKGAPVIATPLMRPGQSFKNFVPNNDRDSVESKKFENHTDYLAALAKIRTSKDIRPVLFDAETGPRKPPRVVILRSCAQRSIITAVRDAATRSSASRCRRNRAPASAG